MLILFLVVGENKQLEEIFGVVLREIRLKKQISQEGLALECGLDRTYISLLERGLRQPSLRSIFQIGDALRTSPSKIVARVEKKLKES